MKAMFAALPLIGLENFHTFRTLTVEPIVHGLAKPMTIFILAEPLHELFNNDFQSDYGHPLRPCLRVFHAVCQVFPVACPQILGCPQTTVMNQNTVNVQLVTFHLDLGSCSEWCAADSFHSVEASSAHAF